MAELTGMPGFAPPRKENTASRRRAATIELIATVGLTISLVVAATAVSLGNRSLTHGELIERGGVQSPTGTLLDQADDWLSVSVRFSGQSTVRPHALPLAVPPASDALTGASGKQTDHISFGPTTLLPSIIAS